MIQRTLIISIWILFTISCADKSKNPECDLNPFVSADNNGFKFYYAKRGMPKDVQPLIHNNIEYSAPLYDKDFEDSVGCIGFIIAKDLSNDSVIWKKKIYRISYDMNLETDVQDCYIDSLVLKCDNLFIHNENGSVFMLNLLNKNLTQF